MAGENLGNHLPRCTQAACLISGGIVVRRDEKLPSLLLSLVGLGIREEADNHLYLDLDGFSISSSDLVCLHRLRQGTDFDKIFVW
jgi:hypothetical protein